MCLLTPSGSTFAALMYRCPPDLVDIIMMLWSEGYILILAASKRAENHSEVKNMK